MRRLATILGIAALLGALTPLSTAAAADSNGCSWSVASLGADGNPVDEAAAPGAGGTADQPLKVDPAGSIAWQGSTDTVITNGTWTVSVAGVQVLSGGAENAGNESSGTGTKDLSTIPGLSLLLSGSTKIPFSGKLTGAGGTCTGSGYIVGTGSLVSAPLFWAGLLASILGLLMAGWVLLGTTSAAAGTTVGGIAA